MTIKKQKHGAKARFIRKHPQMSAKALTSFALDHGVHIEERDVWRVRSYDKNKKMSAMTEKTKPAVTGKAKSGRAGGLASAKARRVAARVAKQAVRVEPDVVRRSGAERAAANGAHIIPPQQPVMLKRSTAKGIDYKAALIAVAAELGYREASRILDEWYETLRADALKALHASP